MLGFNRVMLYTEDTYEIPGEDFFGYLRGRYTGGELKEIDRHCAALGIELVGCIQTLAHLEQVFRWPGDGELRTRAQPDGRRRESLHVDRQDARCHQLIGSLPPHSHRHGRSVGYGPGEVPGPARADGSASPFSASILLASRICAGNAA